MAPPAARVPLLLDVDTGIDDAMALLYAAASPEAELVAVTCVAGNVPVDQVAANTLAVLELAGRPDVEVAVGREGPILRPLRTAEDTHGPKGVGHAVLPPARTDVSPRSGVDLIVEEARSRPGELTLVTLGPLTNLAAALQVEPDLPRVLPFVQGAELCIIHPIGMNPHFARPHIHIDARPPDICTRPANKLGTAGRRARTAWH